MDKWKKFCLHLTAAASWFLTQSSLTTAQPPAIVPEELNDTDEIYLRQHKPVRANDSKVASQIDELFEGEFTETVDYGHRSHSSHRSHYSGSSGIHRSHISHQSHYSGSDDYDDGYGSGSSSSGSSGGGSRSSAQAPKKDIISVADIQKQLNLLGYSCGTESGEKDANTVNAIKTFQIEYGLPADGIVDWKTES